MPRAPISGVVGLVLGSAFAYAAMILVGWVALTYINLPRAFDWAMWAGRNYPWLNFDGVPALEFGNWLIDRVWMISVGAFLLAAFAVGFLRAAHTHLLPADRSDDGDCRFEFTSGTPRAGRMFEGRVWLPRRVHPGDSFTVRLKCTFLRLVSYRYGYESGAESGDEFGQEERIAHQRDREVKAVEEGKKCFVPFSFEIPPAAHVDKKHYWRLEVFPGKNPSGKTWTFAFKMAPADAGQLRAST